MKFVEHRARKAETIIVVVVGALLLLGYLLR
jgi:hypothetical protein